MTDFQAFFDLERPRHEVWQSCRIETSEPSIVRIPGFPSDDGAYGARAKVRESIPQQRLVVETIGAPDAGTEITISIDPANASGWPTRVKIAQRGSEARDETDLARTIWSQTVADFRLYLTTGVPVGTDGDRVVRDHSLGADTRETTYLEITDVRSPGFAARAGLEVGDGLVSVGGIRIYDTRQLMTVLANREEGRAVTVRVLRKKALVDLEATM